MRQVNKGTTDSNNGNTDSTQNGFVCLPGDFSEHQPSNGERVIKGFTNHACTSVVDGRIGPPITTTNMVI